MSILLKFDHTNKPTIAFTPVHQVQAQSCDDNNSDASSFNSTDEILHCAEKCYESTILDLEEAYFHDDELLHSPIPKFKGKVNRKSRCNNTGRRKNRNNRNYTSTTNDHRYGYHGKNIPIPSSPKIPIINTSTTTRTSTTILIQNERRRRRNDKTKSKSMKRKSKERRRQATRRDARLVQLQARKQNIQERVGPFLVTTTNDEHHYDHDQYQDSGYYEEQEVLPAKDLGIDEGENYQRLLEILEGDEITPEDYEILLQLDTNNKKSTLSEDVLNEIPILVLGRQQKKDDEEAKDEGLVNLNQMILREEIGCSQCDICMEAWDDLEDGKELRRLPCGHTFCKECIDHWLSEVSQKCPNLSCYWCQDG